MADDIPTLDIIGAGRVGRTLGRLWHRAGVFRVHDVLCSRVEHAGDACRFIGAGRPVSDLAEMTGAAITLFSVPDTRIGGCAEQVAAAGRALSGAVGFHVSGSVAAEVLAPLRARGAAVAAVHPVRSFADPQRACRDFPGTWCGTEGDAAALKVVGPAVERIGGRLFTINAGVKALYHAACVTASNHLVTILDAAIGNLLRAGVAPEVAVDLVAHIARTTTENVAALGPERALTGPVLRGDAETIDAHLAAMDDPEQRRLYRALARATLGLARRAPGWSGEGEESLSALLEGEDA